MTILVSLRHGFDAFDLDVAFEAPPGVTVLFGPSGSGKTTLINAVAGLLRPDEGRIALEDWVLSIRGRAGSCRRTGAGSATSSSKGGFSRI